MAAVVDAHRRPADVEPELWRPTFADRTAMIYVGLWLLEGALRKWGPVSLSTPLYFARDGVVIVVLGYLLALGTDHRKVPRALAWTEWGLFLFAVVQLVASTTPVAVGVVGVRQYVGPLLFIHLVVKYCDRRLFWTLARIVVVLAPAEAALSLAQVLSPAQSFLNQTGPEVYGVIYSGGDVVRASGTFTAPYGIVAYLMIALPLSLGMFGRKSVPGNLATWNRVLLLPSLLLTCLISGSRSAILLAVACLVARLLVARSSGETGIVVQMLRILIPVVLATGLAFMVAPGVLSAFQDRFSNAEQTQSTSDRFQAQLFGFTEQMPSFTLLGDGLGANSMGGVAAGSSAPWVEDEPGRWIKEAGFVGLAMVVARFIGGIVLVFASWRWARRAAQPELHLLALILASNLIGGLVNTQPTQQGAAAIAAALLILPHVRGTRS